MRIVNVSCSIRRKSVPGYSRSICSHCFFVLLIMLLSVHQLFGQMNLGFRIHHNSYSINNPAATGLFNKHFASFSGFEMINKPFKYKLGTLLYDYKIDKISSGIGINLGYYNVDDFMNNLSVALNYAYHLDVGEEGCFSAGVSLGNINSHIDYKALFFEDQLPDGSTIYYEVMKSNESKLFANFGFMYSYKNLLFGISVAERFLQPVSERSVFEKDQWAVNMIASYDFNINEKLVITPEIFVLRYAEYYDRIDYRVLLKIKERYWAGLTYSDESSYAVMLGSDIQGKYRIGAALKKEINYKNSYFIDNVEIAVALMIK